SIPGLQRQFVMPGIVRRDQLGATRLSQMDGCGKVFSRDGLNASVARQADQVRKQAIARLLEDRLRFRRLLRWAGQTNQGCYQSQTEPMHAQNAPRALESSAFIVTCHGPKTFHGNKSPAEAGL